VRGYGRPAVERPHGARGLLYSSDFFKRPYTHLVGETYGWAASKIDDHPSKNGGYPGGAQAPESGGPS
jgi:hypothetical protein